MVEQFPIVLRGYDKDRVDEAFASAQETVNRLREQVKADDQTISQAAGAAAGGKEQEGRSEVLRVTGRQRPADARQRGTDQRRAA